MPLLDTDVQTIIKLEVGDVDPATGQPPSPTSNGVLYTNMTLFWSSYADKALIAPRLQELYTKRRAIDAVRAVVQVDVASTMPELSKQAAVRGAQLDQMRKEVQAEIEKIERVSISSSLAVSAAITAAEPVTPPKIGDVVTVAPPDANSGYYTGSPYFPTQRGWY